MLIEVSRQLASISKDIKKRLTAFMSIIEHLRAVKNRINREAIPLFLNFIKAQILISSNSVLVN